MTVAPGEFEGLAKLLAGAFNEIGIEQAVLASTGDFLYDAYVARGLPKRDMIFNLLVALNQEGGMLDFLAEVMKRRPQKLELRNEILRIAPEVATIPVVSWSIQAAGKTEAQGSLPGLQRNVRPHLAKLDVRIWLSRMTQVERLVCRVEHRGSACGTGFLVGPDLILTNWHVVESFAGGNRMGELACRFDYLLLEEGARQQGVLARVHNGPCVASTPYAAAEKGPSPQAALPSLDELDYALVQLEDPAALLLASGEPRGLLTLPDRIPDLPQGMPLLIVQHPDGAPMKFALDTDSVIALNDNGTRVRYRTNTDPGASGSPVFTMDWELVALHHLGDPAWGAPAFNQGVPIHLVKKSIQAQAPDRLQAV